MMIKLFIVGIGFNTFIIKFTFIIQFVINILIIGVFICGSMAMVFGVFTDQMCHIVPCGRQSLMSSFSWLITYGSFFGLKVLYG